jgi:hypothetical protein
MQRSKSYCAVAVRPSDSDSEGDLNSNYTAGKDDITPTRRLRRWAGVCRSCCTGSVHPWLAAALLLIDVFLWYLVVAHKLQVGVDVRDA